MCVHRGSHVASVQTDASVNYAQRRAALACRTLAFLAVAQNPDPDDVQVRLTML